MPDTTTQTLITPADIETMRRLAEKWHKDFRIAPHGNGFRLDYLMQSQSHHTVFYSHTGFQPLGPAILTMALQEVMRREGYSLNIYPDLETNDWGALMWKGYDSPEYPINHSNPAIAALRCVAEYLKPNERNHRL